MPFGQKEAKVRFMDADFDVIEKGDFVRCAVTGRPIPLNELRYWSVKRQEAYASAEIALKRHQQLHGGDGNGKD
jgi:hypothetical protein